MAPNKHTPMARSASRSSASTDGSLDPVVKEAKDRFERCSKWEHDARKRWMDDYKFAHADAYNGYQWPQAIRTNRDLDERPCLTINKVRQHNLMIKNDAKKNRPAIKIRGTGNGATAESAKVYNSITRRIEYQSNAQAAYDTACGYMVDAGVGYFRIVTEYAGPDTFDQEPFIRRVWDPLTVYLDPDARELDKSDSQFGFIFDDVNKKEFDKKYPAYVKYASQNSIDDADGWIKEDYIRLCEYFRKVEKKDILFAIPQKEGPPLMKYASEYKDAGGSELVDGLKKDPEVKKRETSRTVIEYFLIIGEKIVTEESTIWPGKYIPIIPVIGEETIIEGSLDRKGHTRAMLDPQRMYNYWSSTAVEFGALQTKTPWIAAAEAIEGYETYWNNANKVNASILPYNGLDDAGNKIAPPQRVEPPVAAPVALTGMQIAQQELMLVSGQYAAQMGEQGNERSAAAIDQRQQQSDTSTFHYRDNLAIAIRLLGKMLLDLIPKLYDTKRIMQCLAEDGTDFEVEIDPKQQQAMMLRLNHDNQVVARIFNPSVGKYEVEADVGPDYGTKRQETAQALTLVLTQAPQLAAIVSDLLVKSMDFPLADEAAARLRRMVPPQALGTGPSLQEQALQQQVQNLTNLLTKALQQHADLSLRLRGKDQARDIEAYKAFTDRLKVFLDKKEGDKEKVSANEISAMVEELVQDVLDAPLKPVTDAAEKDIAALDNNPQPGMSAPNSNLKPPFPGAKMGPNGQWYVRDFGQSKEYRPVS